MAPNSPATLTDAERALVAWGFAGARLSRISGGLINDTFEVEHAGSEWVLQRVNPIFSEHVQSNILAVTEHLAKKGLPSPRLIPNRQGSYFSRLEGQIWRILTRVNGVSLKRPDVHTAALAGQSLGIFHTALADLEHSFQGLRTGVHDTAAHLHRLQVALDSHAQHRLFPEVSALGEALLRSAEQLPPLVDELPRLVHGDPKFDNLLFSPEEPQHAVCWIDLDTVGPASLASELGDAWRSWCNLKGENEAQAEFSLAIYESSLHGYASTASALSSEAQELLVHGVEWITLELAARFLRDALEEAYFGWDPLRFPGAGEHQLMRGRGQWSLHQQVLANRKQRAAILHGAFGRRTASPCV